MLPFFVTVKRTGIPEDAKLQELRAKMAETIYFQDSLMTKAEMLRVDQIHERVKKEQIHQMFLPRMKELNLSQKYELFCFDKNHS